jgi:protein-tyrosine phosphatase
MNIQPVSEQLRRHRYVLCALLAAIAVGQLASQVRTAPSVGIENTTCIETGPGAYRIEFQASPGAGSVAIFASSRADQVDSQDPLVKAATSPAEVRFGDGSRRIYFHLKPAFGPTRVVATRRLPLAGAPNFRDLGGYRTADGRYTRWGLMFRSGNLSKLTEKDLSYLNPLGIRLVCDFRMDFERKTAPTAWTDNGAPEVLLLPMDTYGNLPPGADKDLTVRMDAVYKRFPVESAPEMKQAFLRLVNGDLPALVHCSAGKDRTGMFVAFLLSALGVPRATVMQDFLLSNQYLNATSVSADWLNEAFQTVGEKSSSFDDYLKKIIGLSDSDLAALRSRLVEQQ